MSISCVRLLRPSPASRLCLVRLVLFVCLLRCCVCLISLFLNPSFSFISTNSFDLLTPLSVPGRPSNASIRCVHLVRPSRASISCCPSHVVRLLLFVSFNILNDSSGSIVYLPIHSNVFISISLKRLSGSTCLTGFEVFGVFGVFEVFKGVRLVQRLNRYSMVTPC